MARFSWQQAGFLALSLGMSACAGLPEISRTQVVRDINVEMQLQPGDLTVAPGDEVRWVNLRKEWVLVQIPELDSDDLLCQNGFSNWRGGMLESVKIEPNETVSLCFRDPAEVLYNVRVQTSVAGGEIVLPGSIRVSESDAM